MARRKAAALVPVDTSRAIAPLPPKPEVLNPDQPYDPANPHSWLVRIGDPPCKSGLRIMWGVLRRQHRQQANSARAFFEAKLRPSWSADPLAVTAARAEVLAPAGVDDSWAEPMLVAARLDHELAGDAAGKTALVGYATISDPDAQSVHGFWEEVRRVTRGLVDSHGCPILAVMHAPGRAGSGNPLHAHLCIVPYRVAAPLGLAGRVDVFCGDRGRQVIVDAWHNRQHFG